MRFRSLGRIRGHDLRIQSGDPRACGETIPRRRMSTGHGVCDLRMPSRAPPLLFPATTGVAAASAACLGSQDDPSACPDCQGGARPDARAPVLMPGRRSIRALRRRSIRLVHRRRSIRALRKAAGGHGVNAAVGHDLGRPAQAFPREDKQTFRQLEMVIFLSDGIRSTWDGQVRRQGRLPVACLASGPPIGQPIDSTIARVAAPKGWWKDVATGGQRCQGYPRSARHFSSPLWNVCCDSFRSPLFLYLFTAPPFPGGRT